MIPKSVQRFPACTKPMLRSACRIELLAGEGKSEKIVRRQEASEE